MPYNVNPCKELVYLPQLWVTQKKEENLNS